jgi:hypothetical protein
MAILHLIDQLKKTSVQAEGRDGRELAGHRAARRSRHFGRQHGRRLEPSDAEFDARGAGRIDASCFYEPMPEFCLGQHTVQRRPVGAKFGHGLPPLAAWMVEEADPDIVDLGQAASAANWAWRNYCGSGSGGDLEFALAGFVFVSLPVHRATGEKRSIASQTEPPTMRKSSAYRRSAHSGRAGVIVTGSGLTMLRRGDHRPGSLSQTDGR